MKLEKIRFYNINSLKGEHSISFDDGLLADAGLFAITGPTGSGKSTILDVITLALYNYIPRLGKISKTSIEKMGSIVTHFTNEAWAEVEYTSNNTRYLSKWSISKNRNGKFREYEMDLIELPLGKSEGLKKSEIPNRNTEIIGLSYDQFLKSILLSQGEFSKFLKANKDDRSKLLEEITGTHIYRDLGRLAYERTKDKKQKVDQLRAKIETVLLLGETELSSINEELTNLQNQQDLLEKESSKFETFIFLINLEEQINSRNKAINSKSTELKDLEHQAKEDLSLLEKHREAKEHEKEINELLDSLKNINRLEKEILQHNKNIDFSTIEKTRQITALSQLIKLDVAESTFYEQMEFFEKEIIELDSELNILKDQGSQLRKRIKSISLQQALPNAKQFTENIKANTALNIIQTRLAELSLSNELTQEDLQEKWTKFEEQKAKIRRYVVLFEQVDKSINKKKDLEQKRRSYDLNLKESSSKWEKLTILKKEHNLQLEKLLKEFEAAKQKADFAAHRSILMEGEPCPLCGAEHHPYAHQKELAELGIMSLEIHQYEKQNKSFETELVQLQTNKIQSENALLQVEHSIVEENLVYKSSEKERQAFLDENSWILNIADDHWEEKIIQLDHESNSIKIQLQQLEEYKFLSSLQIDFEQLISTTNQFIHKRDARRLKFNGESITSVTNQLQNKFTSAIQNIDQQHKSINEKQAQNKLLSERNIELAQKLAPLQLKYDLTNALNCQELILANSELNRISSLSNSIQDKKVEVSTLITENKNADKIKEEKLKSLSKTEIDNFKKNTEESLKDQNAQAKRKIAEINKLQGAFQNKLAQNQIEQDRHAIYSKELEELQKENKLWILLSDLIGSATGKKFSNYAQDLTLIHLLTRANARLESLSDRYSLSFRPDEEDLVVIDKYQGDTERAVKTLSGGETFLISLALALSLSDFASQKVRLESLFIDEGFGTLDGETLDIAMGTLEKLQHDSGKRIGIISHVASLKERINTQIKVKKNAQGYSKIEILNL